MNKQERRNNECWLYKVDNPTKEMVIRGCPQCSGHDLTCKTYIPYRKAQHYGSHVGRRFIGDGEFASRAAEGLMFAIKNEGEK